MLLIAELLRLHHLHQIIHLSRHKLTVDQFSKRVEALHIYRAQLKELPHILILGHVGLFQFQTRARELLHLLHKIEHRHGKSDEKEETHHDIHHQHPLMLGNLLTMLRLDYRQQPRHIIDTHLRVAERRVLERRKNITIGAVDVALSARNAQARAKSLPSRRNDGIMSTRIILATACLPSAIACSAS